ncbi:MAG: hypothetical protein KDD37_01685, partial [Bdellovibrionales bacterium]|nr:hypothetical protein [Bdellovibrionales bacterium]
MLKWQNNEKGVAIPYIEGKPLCSKVNPEREASAWAEKVVSRLYSTTDAIFVLGYGAGYHIEALKKLTQHKIIVFEIIEEIANTAVEDEQLNVIYFNK